ncbi:MAG: type II secretion system secretin GspD [Gammaproteobacteria bacterium]
MLVVCSSLAAQNATITPNYKDADIRQIIEAVSDVTGRNFIVDPRVKAQVTMLSSTPMSADAFYETFLSILDVYGFVAVRSGDVVKILPDANARQIPGAETYGTGQPSSDDIITQVVEVRNIGAAQLVPILRPLIPQYGHLAAHPPSNMLIISDRAANVRRMLRIIGRIDQAGDEDIEVVPLEHATAGDIVRVLTSLTQAQRVEGAGQLGLVADDRTNSVLISGERNQRLKLRTLIAHLDTPLEDGGNTRVRYLRYANAEELSTKLQSQFSGSGALAGAQAAQAAAGGAAATAGPVQIWADELTNALIVTAPPKAMRAIMAVVDKLDIRRAQVLVEAIIVEIAADKSAELGVEWAVDGSDDNNAIGITNFPANGPNLLGLAGAAGGTTGTTGDPANALAAIGTGITLGVGRISDNGTSFVALLRALQGDADTNIISTPTIVTMDNEEASIEVGQEVPFVTGQFTNTGAAAGAVNPFQTINRESVGTKLEITPQISEGESIVLKINQEISSIAQGATGAVDLITQERKISTSVIVENGGILVLGGLIDDTIRESDQRVPLLGSIPLLGNLFRSRATNTVKANLMVFIRPSILRTPVDTHLATSEKYNYMRELQTKDGVGLMPDKTRPTLPPLETYVPLPPTEIPVESMPGEDLDE